MKASIRSVHSPDVPDIESWVPPDPASFGLLLQIIAGPSDGEGEESFDITVCTPEWLKSKYGVHGVIIARHHLLVFNFDRDRIWAAIEGIVEQCEGDDWLTVASRLGRFAKWEFEDYVPRERLS